MVKNRPANAGDAEDAEDVGLIPGSRGSPGGENDNPFQYSCLENSMTEEPGGLQSMGSQSRIRLKQLSTCTNLPHPQPLLGSPFIMILGPCEQWKGLRFLLFGDFR